MAPPAQPPVRVVIADADPLTRQAITATLNGHGCTVVAQVGTATDAVALVTQHQPDVALLDVSLPGHGFAAARDISRRLPQIAVVMLTSRLRDDELFDALNAGAHGYLSRDIPPARLAAAVVGAARGQAAVSREMVARVIEELKHHSAARSRLGPRGARLTEREWEVLGHLADGLDTAQIAQRLFVSAATVRSHVAGAVRKLGAADREAAVRLLARP